MQKKHAYKFNYLLSTIRIALLLFLLSLFVFDLFNKYGTFDRLYAFFMLFSLFLISQYRIKQVHLFFVPLLVLFAHTIVLIFHQTILYSKLANWFYISLVLFAVRSFLLESKNRNAFFSFNQSIRTDLIRSYRFIKSALHLNKKRKPFYRLQVLSLDIINIALFSFIIFRLNYLFSQVYKFHFIENHLYLPTSKIILFANIYVIFPLLISIVLVVYLKQKISIKSIVIPTLILLAMICTILVAQQKTNQYYFSQVIIFDTSPDEASLWKNITIYGRNFGQSQYNEADVMLSGVSQRVIRWTDTKIVFVCKVDTPNRTQLQVINVDQKKSGERQFDYSNEYR